MTTPEKAFRIHCELLKTYGPQKCPLEHSTTFQLLVAVILSAQCTDEKVNAVTKILFKKYPDASSLQDASLSDVEKILRPAGLFHAKSRNIIATSKLIQSVFNGSVPSSMQELTSLPGVGRKTANVILGDAFNMPAFPVDTHVIRLLNRIGLVKTKDPLKIELRINITLPPASLLSFAHLLKAHGRARCKALSPDCARCEIRNMCLMRGLAKKAAQTVKKRSKQ